MKKAKMISAVLILSGLLLSSCAIKPLAYQPKTIPSFEGATQLNNKLATSEKIEIDNWYGPEDILFDSLGNIYTGVHNADFSDGRILKVDPSGKVEEFYNSGSWVAGLHFDKESNVIALSHKQGLISISPTKNVTVLAPTDEHGRPFLIPNGISIREDGTYWLGFSTKRNKALDEIHPKTGMKKFVYGLPEFVQPKAEPFGMVMNISTDGEILETLFDSEGVVLPEAGAVKEFNGYLYIGGDVLPYIGKYKLDTIN